MHVNPLDLGRVTIESRDGREHGAPGQAAAFSGAASGAAPPSVCPFFYHNLVPYIVTLLNDGWFGWVKKDKDPFRRRPLAQGLFTGASVNGAFPNEVLVQCPNTISPVVAGVGVISKDNKKTVTLRILKTNGKCPAGYVAGEQFFISEKRLPLPPSAFNAIYPAILLLAAKGGEPYSCRVPENGAVYALRAADGTPADAARDVCAVTAPRTVEAGKIKAPCRYHKKPAGGIRATPNGMCAHALHAVYPFALALAYKADFKGKDAITAHCPGASNSVIFSVERIKAFSRWQRFAINAFRRMFERLFHPIDIPEYRVFYTVREVDGACPAGLKPGARVEFNMNKKDELCPAAFHAAYPGLILKGNGESPCGERPCGEHGNEDVGKAHCPDCMGATYRF